MTQVEAQVDKARRLTDDEVAFYHEHGWVKVERLISPELAGRMLEAAKGIMGEEPHGTDDMMVAAKAGDRLGVTRTGGRVLAAGTQWQDYHYLARDDGVEPQHSYVFSKEMGENAQRLMGRDVQVRYWTDLVAAKMPAQLGGGPTNWHQDLINFPVDRTGGLSVWLALNDLPPERGTMRFLSGSFREGPLGRNRDETALSVYPWLEERHEVSPPLHLKPGDATIHGALTFHSAPANTTDEPRWAFITMYMPGDCRYTGAPHARFEGTGLNAYDLVDHPRFTVVYP